MYRQKVDISYRGVARNCKIMRYSGNHHVYGKCKVTCSSTNQRSRAKDVVVEIPGRVKQRSFLLSLDREDLREELDDDNAKMCMFIEF